MTSTFKQRSLGQKKQSLSPLDVQIPDDICYTLRGNNYQCRAETQQRHLSSSKPWDLLIKAYTNGFDNTSPHCMTWISMNLWGLSAPVVRSAQLFCFRRNTWYIVWILWHHKQTLSFFVNTTVSDVLVQLMNSFSVLKCSIYFNSIHDLLWGQEFQTCSREVVGKQCFMY